MDIFKRKNKLLEKSKEETVMELKQKKWEELCLNPTKLLECKIRNI